MDFLRNLFGNLTSGIIRLLVTVGILAAAYFFIVKPVLKTTDNAIDSANKSFEKSFGTNGVDITDISGTIEDVNNRSSARSASRSKRRSTRATRSGWSGASNTPRATSRRSSAVLSSSDSAGAVSGVLRRPNSAAIRAP